MATYISTDLRAWRVCGCGYGTSARGRNFVEFWINRCISQSYICSMRYRAGAKAGMARAASDTDEIVG
jgi:hypothetical protein